MVPAEEETRRSPAAEFTIRCARTETVFARVIGQFLRRHVTIDRLAAASGPGETLDLRVGATGGEDALRRLALSLRSQHGVLGVVVTDLTEGAEPFVPQECAT